MLPRRCLRTFWKRLARKRGQQQQQGRAAAKLPGPAPARQHAAQQASRTGSSAAAPAKQPPGADKEPKISNRPQAAAAEKLPPGLSEAPLPPPQPKQAPPARHRQPGGPSSAPPVQAPALDGAAAQEPKRRRMEAAQPSQLSFAPEQQAAGAIAAAVGALPASASGGNDEDALLYPPTPPPDIILLDSSSGEATGDPEAANAGEEDDEMEDDLELFIPLGNSESSDEGTEAGAEPAAAAPVPQSCREPARVPPASGRDVAMDPAVPPGLAEPDQADVPPGLVEPILPRTQHSLDRGRLENGSAVHDPGPAHAAHCSWAAARASVAATNGIASATQPSMRQADPAALDSHYPIELHKGPPKANGIVRQPPPHAAPARHAHEQQQLGCSTANGGLGSEGMPGVDAAGGLQSQPEGVRGAAGAAAAVPGADPGSHAGTGVLEHWGALFEGLPDYDSGCACMHAGAGPGPHAAQLGAAVRGRRAQHQGNSPGNKDILDKGPV